MLGIAIGDILPAAVVVAISPLNIAAAILMLLGPRATRNGSAFLAGWVAGLALVTAAALVVATALGIEAEGGGEPTSSGGIKLVLGVALLALAVKVWRSRPREAGTAKEPRWMTRAAGLSGPGSAMLGLGVSAANPKNLALAVAAAVTVAGSGLAVGEEIVTLAVFVAIGALGVAIPVVVALVAGDRAETALHAAQRWLVDNNATVMTVLLLVIGAKLVGDSLGILAR